MAFVTKTWKDRLVEFAGRRKLKNVSTNEEVLYDVSRSEGTVMQAGDSFSATNMNDLEQRIKTEFDNVSTSLNDLGGFKPIIDETTGKITGYKTTLGGADTVFPFSSDMTISFKVRCISLNYKSEVMNDTTKGPYYIYIKDGVLTTSFTNSQILINSYKDASSGWTNFYITDIAIVEEE